MEVMSLQDVLASLARDKKIYDALSPDDRAEVDAHNARMRGKSLEQIIAMGVHPMQKHRDFAAGVEQLIEERRVGDYRLPDME